MEELSYVLNFHMQTIFLNGSCMLQTIFNSASLSYLRYMYIPSHKLLRLLHLVAQRHQPKYYLRRPSTFNVPIFSTNRIRQSFLPLL